MRFRLFGGLDCPDAILAQLSILANSDVLTPKAVAALTEHVVGQLLIDFAIRALPVKSHGTLPSDDVTPIVKKGGNSSTLSRNERQQLRADRSKALQGLFADVCAPYLAVLNGDIPTTEASAQSLDGFATKLVAHTLEARKLRALQAEAAARKFVVAASASSVEESGEYDPTQALETPAFAERALSMVVDGLSQVLVCLGTLIENAAKYLLTNEAFSTELTMLGVNPQTAESIVETLTNSLSAVDLGELGVVAPNTTTDAVKAKKGRRGDEGNVAAESAVASPLEIAGADGVGIGIKTLFVLYSRSSVVHNQPSHIRVEPVIRESLQHAISEAAEAATAKYEQEVESLGVLACGNPRTRRVMAAKEALDQHLEGGGEEGAKRILHRLHWVSNAAPNPIGAIEGGHFAEFPEASRGTRIAVDLTHQQAVSLLAELMLARELMVPANPSIA